jgi:adenosylhomocysteine nucleosidase
MTTPASCRPAPAQRRRVGIVAALETEARPLGALPRGVPYGELLDGSLLAVSGVGTAAAERSAAALVAGGARALASWGFAGALDPALAPGCVFLPHEVSMGQGAALPTASGWRELIAAALGGLVQAGSNGRLVTSSHVVASRAAKAACRSETGAAAVDMESFAIAQVAERHELPFVCVRVIVDGAGDALPPAVVRAGTAGPLRTAALLSELVRSPSQWAAVLRLARRYATARRALHAVARAGCLTECPA